MRIFRSLAVPIVLVLALLASGALYLGYRINIHSLRETMEAREKDEARETVFIINSIIKEDSQRLSSLSRILQENRELAEALAFNGATGDYLPLKRIMDRLYPLMRTDAFVVTDAWGKVIYRANNPDSRGDLHLVWGMDEALAGSPIMVAARGPSGWAVRALAPVFQKSDLLGVIILVNRLTDQFAQKIAAATNTDIFLGAASGVVASSLPPGSPSFVDPERIKRAILEHEPFFMIDYQLNKSFKYVPLRVEDETLCLVVRTDTTAVTLLLQDKRRQFFQNFLYILLATIALGAFFTFLIIRPLRRLQSRAQKVIQDFSGKNLPVRPQGNEITSLAAAFDLMLLTIRSHVDRLRQAKHHTEETLSMLSATLEATADGILVVTDDGKTILNYNTRFQTMWGLSEAALRSGDSRQAQRAVLDQLVDPEGFLSRIKALYAEPEAESRDLLEFKDGRKYERVSLPYRLGGQITGRVLSFRDITARVQAEEALRQANEKLATLIQASPLPIIAIDLEGRVTIWNPAAERIFGWSREEALGHLPPIVPPAGLDDFHRIRHTGHGGECLMGKELAVQNSQGSLMDVKLFTAALYDAEGRISGEVAIIEDITAYKQAQAALRDSEDQLRQAQKMEAVGRLAGGVAHDFNNILTAIQGYSELLLLNLKDEDALPEIQEIQKAADRAAGLTRQLLAFSRKQVFQAKILDLNQVMQNLDKMLRRVIGEDIDLVFLSAEGLGRVQADPGQIEQVIMNLAVNARDAMPQGGKLTIETANVELGEAYAREHLGVQPGPYVLLSVSDTGTGLDEETRARLFEPFFTTKEQGKGTGLGLSMVYGIIKQSGGHIWVYSEPGQGTSFKLYLPRVDASGEAHDLTEAPAPPPPGTETVLLVEDEDLVRQVVHRILEKHGYTILAASRGAEALKICDDYPGPIALILSDVVMPEMSGRQTVDAVQRKRPGIKALYMSGHTENAIVRHGVLESGLAFIQKPFRHEELIIKIREVLDAPGPAAATPDKSRPQVARIH